MAPHSSTLDWKIPWTEEPGRLQSMGSLRVGHDWVTSLSCIGGGNGNPLQCSCLENPRDSGAWWAAVYGVAQSRTRLKQLSSSLNLVIFDKNEGNFREKKIFQKMLNPSLLMRSASSKTHLFDTSLLLCDTNIKFNWILKEQPKFVSEAYLSNVSLDEDQMPHDLQPGLEKDIS